MQRDLWKVFLVTGVAAALAYHVVASARWGNLISAGIDAVAVVAILVGVRVHRRAHARLWYVLACLPAFWCVGYLISEGYVLATGAYPSGTPADVFYLLGNVAVIIGLSLTLSRRASRSSFLDVGIAVFAVAQVAWVALIADYLNNPGLSFAQRGSQVSYAVLDIVAFALLCRILVSPGRRRAQFMLFAAGAAALLAADAAFNWMTLISVYSAASSFDFGWLLAIVLVAAAALHPASDLYPSTRASERRAKWGYLGLLALASMTGPTLRIIDTFYPATIKGGEGIAVAVGTATLALLVIARMIGFVRVAEKVGLVQAQNFQLRELDRLKDDLVSSVSHELRTPLTSINGYLELLIDDRANLNEEQAEFLAVMSRNTQRLTSLVSDLLFVAQVRSGQMALEKEAVNVVELVQQSFTAALPHATERELTFSVGHCDAAEVVGDRQRLAQVIDNLLSNALKFTPAGGAVEISVRARDDSVVMEISDTGMGISAVDQTELFTRFFRTNDALKGAIQGTGLGLSIVKSIVEGHGGEITVESAEGEGSTFRVTLPRAAAATASPFKAAA
ncbi:MAG: ATP-binding protein [Actinomycetota bacterium]